MPKFKMEQSFSLKDALHNIGMTDMFNASKANFTNFSADEPLYVSEVVHKSFLEVSALHVVVSVASHFSPLHIGEDLSGLFLLSPMLMRGALSTSFLRSTRRAVRRLRQRLSSY